MLPEILANDCELLAQTSNLIKGEVEKVITLTPTQWQATQAKLTNLVQSLKEAQSDIERLTAENLKLHEVNGDLYNEIAHLLVELASLKQK